MKEVPGGSFLKWQCALAVTAWGASLAIPIGIGIMAVHLSVQDSLWFITLAGIMGAAFPLLRVIGRWERVRCRLVLIIGILLSVVIGVAKSLYTLPAAILVAGVIFWIAIDKLWLPVMRSLGRFIFPYRIIHWGVLLLTLLCLVQILRFSLFMVDPSFKPGWPMPYAQKHDNHQCLIAYVHAAALNERGTVDLYNPAWYDPNAVSKSAGAEPAQAKSILAGTAGLLRDVWQYPPQALLLPQLALKITKSYPALRTGWFAIQSVLITILLLFIVRSLGPASMSPALLPLLWCSMPFLVDLEFGQPHFLVLCCASYAAILFEKQRNISGGFLLAWAVSIKLFPAFLVLYLLFRRRFHAVVATIVWSLAIVLVSLPIVGWTPYEAFFEDQLLRIIGGSAWQGYLVGDLAGTGQFTIYGILLSLRQWGGHHILTAAAPYALLVYTVFVVGLMWVSAKRSVSPLAGLALVNLAAMASYYSPPEYAVVGVTALVLLSAGLYGQGPMLIFLTLAMWFFFSCSAVPGSFPVIWKHTAVLQGIYVVSFVAAVLVNTLVAYHRPTDESQR